MATPETNRLVDLYRKSLKYQESVDRLIAEIHARVRGLSPEEFEDYARMTTEIDEAYNRATSLADDANYGPSTRKQVVTRAINEAGLDRR